MDEEWFVQLVSCFKEKGCVILNFESETVDKIILSKNGLNEFTKTYIHDLLKKVSPSLTCFISYNLPELNENVFNIGVLSSKAAISTLESRIKYKHGRVLFSSLDALLKINKDEDLQKNLLAKQSVIYLEPTSGLKLLELLKGFTENNDALRYISDSLNTPQAYSNNTALQEDAVQTALRAFNITNNDFASDVDLVEGQSTALIRLKHRDDVVSLTSPLIENGKIRSIPIIEDNTIAKDTRSVPGYSLKLDSLTGKVLFEKNGEQLEIYTANRTSLERALGVDLIYINLTKNNVVMVQYKMLELNKNSENQDWVYYPDEKLEAELDRMNTFNICLGAESDEYRLNQTAFYLKFVKRDASFKNGAIVIPIDHYEKILNSPKSKGAKNGVRISYNSLNGQYLRQGPFLGLIQSGYIGSYHKTTAALKIIIDDLVKGNRAVIAAIQKENKK